ncbi:hypothetical protein P3TCK_13221 [Photobacterium profundum 3TCK]|uniref:Uncharacterized protein n=1 Tax=Photobacterium profundum 3TCK TaxID=314280 RepID=Q1Z0P3_9GAMM|nr:hypothetical protein P3TCK_13221 [Photobacterium profundum 3TCK]
MLYVKSDKGWAEQKLKTVRQQNESDDILNNEIEHVAHESGKVKN